MNAGPGPNHLSTVTSEFQTSDRLRDILRRARERSAGAAPLPPAQERAQAEASVESLLDRTQPLPDPRALSRLYQEEELSVRLPESLEAEAEAAPAPGPTSPVWLEPPAPAPPSTTDVPGEAPPPPVWAEAEAHVSQPAMSPAEIRKVMQKLQSDFGDSYQLYEIPRAPADDFGARTVQEERDRELAELKRLADESAQSNWVFLLGSVVVVVILGVFIYLAAVGPLKATPGPVATPSATAPAAHR